MCKKVIFIIFFILLMQINLAEITQNELKLKDYKKNKKLFLENEITLVLDQGVSALQYYYAGIIINEYLNYNGIEDESSVFSPTLLVIGLFASPGLINSYFGIIEYKNKKEFSNYNLNEIKWGSKEHNDLYNKMVFIKKNRQIKGIYSGIFSLISLNLYFASGEEMFLKHSSYYGFVSIYRLLIKSNEEKAYENFQEKRKIYKYLSNLNLDKFNLIYDGGIGVVYNF